jgi:hypothetical protein
MDACHYTLSEHVHACETGGVLVFLDLRHDLYFSLDRATSELFAPVLSGQQIGRELDGESSRLLERTVDVLLAQKLIAADGESDEQCYRVKLDRATRSLATARYSSLSNIPKRWWVDFFSASTLAASKLRWWPIGRAVASIRDRRHTSASAADLEKTAELMAAYRSLRPLYPKPYVCLFDSLAALEFLARHQCFPHWVFAVKASPFGAHCWLQEDGAVLNDSVENVSAYTPIMVV